MSGTAEIPGQRDVPAGMMGFVITMFQVHCATTTILAGETSLVCLQCRQTSDVSDKIVLARIIGTLSLDSRWVQTQDKEIVLRNFAKSNDTICLERSATSDNGTGEYLLLTSNEVAVPWGVLGGNGGMLEFTIPRDSFPTHKGMFIHVQYHISLSVEGLGCSEVYSFPVTVRGRGSEEIVYRTISLVYYPTTSVSRESLLQFPNCAKSYQASLGNKSYSIRDNDHICDLFLSRTSVLPGGIINLTLDFSSGKQVYHCIGLSLLSCETRADGTKLQNKKLLDEKHVTDELEILQFALFVPEDCTTSFISPLVQLEHLIRVEFAMNEFGSLEDNNALAMDIPIQIIPSCEIINAMQQVALCIQHTHTIFPVRL